MDPPNVAALVTGLVFFFVFAVIFYCRCFRRDQQAYYQYDT